MKKKLSILLFLAAWQGFAAAQSYLTEKSPSASGEYRKTAHNTIPTNLPTADRTKVVQMIDAVVEAVKKAYPQPIGVVVGPYSGVWQDYRGMSEFVNGPYTVDITIPFYDLYKTSSGKTEPGDEYSYDIAIWINSIKYLLQGNPVGNGNDLVFRSPYPGIPVNGFPKYNNNILIVLPGKPLPWRPATKQEYLENFIIAAKRSFAGRSVNPWERQNVAQLEQYLANMLPSEKKEIAYLRKSRYPNAEAGTNRWDGFRSAADTTAEQLVIIDESFYDKSLPRNSYQAIVLARESSSRGRYATNSTQQEKAEYKDQLDRMNAIVKNTGFLPDLQNLLGKNGMALASMQKTTPKEKFVPKKIDHEKINRKVDSLFRNYDLGLPSVTNLPLAAPVNKSLPEALPARNPKKILLSQRRLETRSDLVQYIDELDKKLSAGLGTMPADYGEVEKNNMASYGYWLNNKPKESLLLAVRAAKEQPDNNWLLNNLGANLSVCGADYMAVPLYIVCLKKEPDNGTLNNNLGQSYLGLGDEQQAEIYLKKALADNPYHHHANNSLGYIYERRGNKNAAIQCYVNSLSESFTLNGMNGLGRLNSDSALKLINYIRGRYRQPDYINFDKYPPPKQCLTFGETEIRKAEHRAYQEMLDMQLKKYDKLRREQDPLAAKSIQELPLRAQQGKAIIKPFQLFATAVDVSVQREFEDEYLRRKKELIEIDKENERLKLEFDMAMQEAMDAFKERAEKVGEGNADPTLDEEICEAKNEVVNYYLPLFAQNNEERFLKIVHLYKDYLNDHLYWVRIASQTEEAYQLAYYEIVINMLKVLKEVRLTTLDQYCGNKSSQKFNSVGFEFKKPDCLFPGGVEIPFVIGKVGWDCEGWSLQAGEVIVVNIDHKTGGETTLAFGPGLAISTPKLFGHGDFALNPSVELGAKGQAFITFEGSHVADGGFLWEAEIDLKGLKKPDLRQTFTWAINKGFTAEGLLTDNLDKIFDVPKEQPINKNIKIYGPDHEKSKD